MDRIEDLPEKLQPIVRNAIADCKFRRAFKNIKTEIGSVYVFPSPNGVRWGISSKYDGHTIRSGVQFYDQG